MENPWALALKEAKEPDDLYSFAFRYFQTLFRSLSPKADVSGTNIFSHDLPDALRGDRIMTGVMFAGALMAMLDHESPNSDAKMPFIEVPVKQQGRLDEIIIAQGAITGAALLTSDLVLRRMSEWERTDMPKYKRWLKALDKAARVHQQRTSAPLTDPYLKEVKRVAVEQLRPVVARMKAKFAKQRRLPTEQEIVEAFAEETRDADAPPFLSHSHNRELWLKFYRRDPVAHLHLSAEKLFDNFSAFVGMHGNAEYVRKKISSLK
jgi:hypothetical protein